jgi:dienelactone hydrolase
MELGSVLRTLVSAAGIVTAFAGVPAQDARNTQTPNTDTHFAAPSYQSLEEWKTRAEQLRKQVRFAAGLLPIPERTPLNAQIFGRIENKDYSIEKVFIETLPGFYLAGNLYRPLGKSGKFPGMLAPHGHAAYGRLEHGELFSVPSRGINHARQGYVVFAYDMIGYNDTMQIPHAFGGAREQLWSFGPLGLQTWNSIRALDFLQSLPDVDAERIVVTGESGGGTQTFLLCAVDDRPKWSAPVNMISLIMQGGSPCENAPGLRVGTNNVEIAALMAPKPMLMVSATGDWTRNTPKEEFPGMKAFYELYGKADDVETILIDAPHNYNKASREAVYRFMAKKVLNDSDASKFSESRIRQEKLQDLMVFSGRALPDNAVTYEKLFENWVRAAKKQNDSTIDPAELRLRLSLALGTQWPTNVEHETTGERIVLTRPRAGDRIPGVLSKGRRGTTLVIHPDGAEAARKSPQAMQAADAGRTVLAIDAFQTGSAIAPRDRSHRYFLTFNRSDDANRVQDILTAISYLRQTGESDITVVGIGKAAVWATFAAAVSEHPVQLQAPLGSFKGEDQNYIDNFFVPGIQRAGGLRAAEILTRTGRGGK